MRIEVATTSSQSTKQKGDLLEKIAAELLRTQSYDVEREVRRTAVELDLLCRHKVNNRQIYVECKAHREPLSATVLRNLLGTVTFHEYSEGWLISAGPLSKDAKGFQVEWEDKPQKTRQKLSIYTPDRVVRALTEAKLISDPPSDASPPTGVGTVSLGEWILLFSEYGKFWVQIVLVSGAPEAVQVFSAEQGELIDDPVLLKRLAGTDSTLSTLNFEYRSARARLELHGIDEDRQQQVVQVQHGESWSDYRPSRPEDFVGRQPAQDSILKFLEAVRSGETTTRVFAVTGDSGMGKSSLIAKLRNRARNTRYRNKFYMYAVDVRAATRPSYILGSLLACLRQTTDSGFIEFDATKLEIPDPSEPLSGETVRKVLEIAREQRRVVCLVFDQFEELYSKPEMFPVFEEAKRLFLSAAAAESNLILGFAWRTDSTVQQDHPAYFMWHHLRDHRFEIPIGPFRHSEASNAVAVFQKALGQKLLPGIRRQIIENSQGYPWLLKKLCIHLYDQLQSGESQAKLVDTLDVETLFGDDLKALSQSENNCLRVIAAQAPADWHEVLETAGVETLRGLQDKRLIVRSGDRINLYWDLFREYVLTGTAPSVPFTYVASASVGALLAVAEELTHSSGKSFYELSDSVGLKASTVQNIVHDLVMFRVAQVSGSHALLDPEIPSTGCAGILDRIREVLKRHALYLDLSTAEEVSEFALDDLIECLRKTNSTAHHGLRTWKTYAERMALWLCTAGLLKAVPDGWILHDNGKPIQPPVANSRGIRGRSRRKAFQAEAPPEKVIACLDWICESSERTTSEVKQAGYRNALGVLVRFGLVRSNNTGVYVISQEASSEASNSLIWTKAWCDLTLRQVRDWLISQPSISGRQIGERLAHREGENWSSASMIRIGNGARRWACWMIRGEESAPPPAILRRRLARGSSVPAQINLFNE